MQRKVQRDRVLPAFSIEVADLEALFTRLVALFEGAEGLYSSIDVELKGEKLSFKDSAELRAYTGLKGRLTRFSIWISAGDRRLSLRSRSSFDDIPRISTEADDEAWCAGAIETACSFLHTYSPWYGWFVSWPIGWILLGLLNLPLIASGFLPKEWPLSQPLFVAWIASVLTLATFYVARKTLLPAASLRITEEGTFIRNHAPEISLVIALLSAALTIIGWFVRK